MLAHRRLMRKFGGALVGWLISNTKNNKKLIKNVLKFLQIVVVAYSSL